MKSITLSATTLILLGTLTVGMADTTEVSLENSVTEQTMTQTQTKEMKQERVRQMNQFKKQLSDMPQEDREAAIAAQETKMQTQTRTQTRTQARTHSGDAVETQSSEGAKTMTQTQTRTMTQQHSRTQEMTQTQQMQQMQQMQQRHGADMEAHGAIDAMQSQAGNMDSNIPHR